MGVISKSLDSVLANLVKVCISGKKIYGYLSIGELSKQIVISVDMVRSREDVSEQGIDILWLSFSFGVIRINADFTEK